MNRLVTYPASACLLAAWLATVGCGLRGSETGIGALAGDWKLERGFGATPPGHLETRIAAESGKVTVRSRWDEPANGQYGLTLIGITVPEMVFDLTGREAATQVGPFVLRHATRIRRGQWTTDWSTSEYMGSSFRGRWTRAVSKDGAAMTLDIEAVSGLGDESRARLVFRRK